MGIGLGGLGIDGLVLASHIEGRIVEILVGRGRWWWVVGAT